MLDQDGYLTITDRKADVIIRGGENISALEVEELLLACREEDLDRVKRRYCGDGAARGTHQRAHL